MMRQAQALRSPMDRGAMAEARTLSVRSARAMWMGLLAVALLLAQAISARALPESFADLAEKISPAVVNITTSTTVTAGTGPSPIVPEGSPSRISSVNSRIATAVMAASRVRGAVRRLAPGS